MNHNILLVEDDPNLGAVLQEFLELKQYKIRLRSDGDEGLQAFLEEKPDLCVLDVMMPKRDGFDLAREIRMRDANVPIIFLTAKGMKEDKIEGFSIGADDYVTKPFSAEELLFRIQAVLRRCLHIKQEVPKTKFSLGAFSFDYDERLLTADNYRQPLTSKEADLLKMLCENKNTVLRREIALKKIWGDDSYFNGRSMDVFITRLRKYMRNDHHVEIVNVHGTGYKLLERAM